MALGFIVSGAFASGQGEVQGPTEYSLGYVAKAGDAYMHELEAGCAAAAKELGVKYYSMTTADANGAEEQIGKVEDLIGMGCNMLVISPNLPDAMIAVLSEAADEGMVIVPVDMEVDFDGRASSVCVSEDETSYQGGKILCNMIGKGGNVVIITGQAGSANAEYRLDGFQRACEESGVNVLAYYYSDWSAEDTASAMEDYIVTYGDKINGAMFTSDSMTVGAIEAIKAAGLTDKILVCSKGGFDIARQAMEKGEMAVDIAHQPYKMSYLAAMTAWDALQGKKVPEAISADVSILTSRDVGTEKFNNFSWIK
jgi:ABC-type sugar transport system substrate-binding protein